MMGSLRLRACLAGLVLSAGCAGQSISLPTLAPAPTPSPAPTTNVPIHATSIAPPLPPTGTGTYGNADGSFSYVYYVPHSARPPYPLVLALHGCLESPADFEAGTRWFEDAEAHGYAVVMPQHVPATLDPKGCWQYWSDHYRDRGEPSVLVGLLGDVERRVAVDKTRVYATGMSSGAAMTVALAADYPDVFAAAASGSGTEYQPCVTDNVGQCYLALTSQQFDQDPVASGRAAFQAAAGSGGKTIPVALFQGDADTVVAPFNLPQALTSIATMNDGIASYGGFPGTWNATPTVHDAGVVPGGYAYDHYSADNGMLDWTIVHGMNHAWSGGVAGPSSNASDGNNYNDSKGPNETAAFRAFLFRYHR